MRLERASQSSVFRRKRKQIILVSIKKLEKLFIAPKARLRLHETV